MGQVVEFAQTLAADLRAGGLSATCDVNKAVPPCVLVVPVPRLEFDLLCGGSTATWTAVILAPGKGDLTDARLLEEQLAKVLAVWPNLERAEPTAYALPTAVDPKPAYLCTFITSVTPEEE